MQTWLQLPFIQGIVFGTLILFFGLGSVWLCQFARTGDAWEQLREKRLSPSSFFFQRGNYYFGGTEYDLEEALANFNRARSFTNTFNDPISYQIGRVHFIKGDLHAAVRAFNAQLLEDPTYMKSYYMRGLTYGYLDDFVPAAADFKTFLESKPASWAGHNDLVWVLFRAGKYKEAETYARQGLTFAPNNPWLSNALGAILINQQRYDEAVFPLTIARDGFVAMSHDEWGRAYPGNDPRVYSEGKEASIRSAEENLQRAQDGLASE